LSRLTKGRARVFRALRHIPALLEIAKDMQELCPNAILFNYANPMAMCCWALGKVPGLKFVGLCHGVQTTIMKKSGLKSCATSGIS